MQAHHNHSSSSSSSAQAQLQLMDLLRQHTDAYNSKARAALQELLAGFEELEVEPDAQRHELAVVINAALDCWSSAAAGLRARQQEVRDSIHAALSSIQRIKAELGAEHPGADAELHKLQVGRASWCGWWCALSRAAGGWHARGAATGQPHAARAPPGSPAATTTVPPGPATPPSFHPAGQPLCTPHAARLVSEELDAGGAACACMVACTHASCVLAQPHTSVHAAADTLSPHASVGAVWHACRQHDVLSKAACWERRKKQRLDEYEDLQVRRPPFVRRTQRGACHATRTTGDARRRAATHRCACLRVCSQARVRLLRQLCGLPPQPPCTGAPDISASNMEFLKLELERLAQEKVCVCLLVCAWACVARTVCACPSANLLLLKLTRASQERREDLLRQLVEQLSGVCAEIGEDVRLAVAEVHEHLASLWDAEAAKVLRDLYRLGSAYSSAAGAAAGMVDLSDATISRLGSKLAVMRDLQASRGAHAREVLSVLHSLWDATEVPEAERAHFVSLMSGPLRLHAASLEKVGAADAAQRAVTVCACRLVLPCLLQGDAPTRDCVSSCLFTLHAVHG
jgi:hypothetical protein